MIARKISLIAGLLLMALSQLGWGVCTPSVNEASQLVFSSSSDGIGSCANMNPASTGCSITSIPGSCTVPGVFTVYAGLNADGSVRWCATASGGANCLGAATPDDPQSKVDVVLVKGATTGNVCGYNYLPDAVKGSSLGDKKPNGNYQNVSAVTACTDNQNVVKQATAPFQACPQDIQDAINDQSLEGDVALIYKVGQPEKTALCVRSDFQVSPCTNDVLVHNDTGLALCNKQDLDGDGIATDPIPFRANGSVEATFLGEHSCVLYCPTSNYNLTSGGTSSTTCYKIETTTGKRC